MKQFPGLLESPLTVCSPKKCAAPNQLKILLNFCFLDFISRKLQRITTFDWHNCTLFRVQELFCFLHTLIPMIQYCFGVSHCCKIQSSCRPSNPESETFRRKFREIIHDHYEKRPNGWTLWNTCSYQKWTTKWLNYFCNLRSIMKVTFHSFQIFPFDAYLLQFGDMRTVRYFTGSFLKI